MPNITVMGGNHNSPIEGRKENYMSKKKKKSSGKRRRAFQAPSQDMENAFVRLVQYLIGGLWKYLSFSIVSYGETCVIAIRKSETSNQPVPKPRQIQYAGAASTEIAYIRKPDVPDKALKEWLRERLRDHIAAVPETLLICIPAEMLEVLVADDLPEERRKLALQKWNELKHEHEQCEDCQRKLRESDSLTGLAVEDVCSDEYIHAYLQSLKLFTVASVLLNGLSPWQICAGMRKAQALSAECPHCRFTGDGLRDASRLMMHLGLTPASIDEAYDRNPKVFQTLGWH